MSCAFDAVTNILFLLEECREDFNHKGIALEIHATYIFCHKTVLHEQASRTTKRQRMTKRLGCSESQHVDELLTETQVLCPTAM